MRKLTWVFILMLLLTSCSKEMQNEDLGLDETAEASIDAIELVESAPIDINIGVSGGGMSYFTVKQFFEVKSYDDNINFNYNIYYAFGMLERDLEAKKIDIGLLPLDRLLLMEDAFIDYKIVGIVSMGYPKLVSAKPNTTLESIKKKNLDVYYEHELFLKNLLREEGLNPDTDVNIVVWNDGEKMLEAYEKGEIENAMFNTDLYQRILAEGYRADTIMDVDAYINKSIGIVSGVPNGVLVIRKTILEAYPEVCEAFEEDMQKNNNWISRSNEEAAVYAQQLGLVDEKKEYIRFLNVEKYYYEPMETSKYKLKKYFLWVDNYLSSDYELINLLN